MGTLGDHRDTVALILSPGMLPSGMPPQGQPLQLTKRNFFCFGSADVG